MSNNGGGSVEMRSFSAKSAKAMEQQAFSLEEQKTPPPTKTADLKFFPTSEGFYDYVKDQYIYQYKDHLGNVRISFTRNSAGALEIADANDYYPFGMNHLKTGNAFFGQSSYKNYQYNGKELQETGMYDYGARFYMPDLGRWGVVDLRSQYTHETYSYVWNNPISFIDPDGMEGELGFPIRDGFKDGEVWYDSDGLFTWNSKKGTWIDANNGSAVITQVSMLDKRNSKDNSGSYATGMALGASTSEIGVGVAVLGVIGLIYTIDQATKPSYEWYTPAQTTIADPGVGMRNLNSDSETEDTDVNGVEVPQEGKSSESETTGTSIKRGSQGKDGAESEHIIEKDKDGNTVSKTHRVSKDGKVIHQHQDHVSTQKNPQTGKHNTRQFPDKWASAMILMGT